MIFASTHAELADNYIRPFFNLEWTSFPNLFKVLCGVINLLGNHVVVVRKREVKDYKVIKQRKKATFVFKDYKHKGANGNFWLHLDKYSK